MDIPSNAVIYDVAIIGGGPSGVYSAWRLQNAYTSGSGSTIPGLPVGQPLNIALFEGSNRIGGRLESLTPPGAPTLRAEFGGMGYSTNHTRVAWLVQQLGLPTTPLILGTPQTINFLRGKYFRSSQANQASLVPYNLAPNESGLSYGQILENAVAKIVPGFPNLTNDQWYDWAYTYSFNGQPLWNAGIWNVLATLMSNEAYNYIEDAMGHMPFLGSWNAAEAFPWNFIDSRDGTGAYTIPTGYNQIILQLFQQYVQNGGTVQMEMPLQTFYNVGSATSPLFYLSFANGTVQYARSLILAMPRRSLEIIASNSDANNPLNQPFMQDLIRTVTPVPHMKLFLAYDTPWWEQWGVNAGHSITDLPLRTIYYEGTESERGGDPNNHNSLLMASYVDGRYIRYWEGLNFGANYPDQPNPFVGPPPSPDYWHEQPVPINMVNEVQRQLALVHYGMDPAAIPMPYSAAWKDWRDDPFGGAWNSWNAGVFAPSVILQMLNPDQTLPLFVVGSAYSQWQGWVEGALQTSDLLLQGVFGIAAPPDSAAANESLTKLAQRR